MGASTVMTHVILFIAILSIASGLLVVIKNYADETEGIFKQKSDQYNLVVKTDIKIEVVSYDNETNTTWIYVRNTGSTDMDITRIDVYIDGIRFPREEESRAIEVLADTETINTGDWNPKEMLLIKAFKQLDDSKSHEVIVTTPYEVRDSETFSI